MKLTSTLLSCLLGVACATAGADRYSVMFVWPSTPSGPAYAHHDFHAISHDQASYATGWFTNATMPSFTVRPIYDLTVLPDPPHTSLGTKLYVTLTVEVSISGTSGATGSLTLAPKPGSPGSSGKGLALARLESDQDLVGGAVRLKGTVPRFVTVGRQVVATTAQEVAGGRISAHLALRLGTLTLANGARGEYRITIVSVSTRPPSKSGPVP